jgi:hypothetical protein
MTNFLKYVVFFMCALTAATASAQEGKITGIVIDGNSKEQLSGVIVLLRRQSDTTTQVSGMSSDLDGKFGFSQLKADTYQLRISYLGYQNVVINNLQLAANANYPLDTIRLKEAAEVFGDIVVEAMAVRLEMVGDTVQYNAAAFKVNPDATIEDLIKKMPGITIENGVVKAQGEQIKKVTIDGKEFFGDDASTALKNLPADIVDKIQVYDRASDQAALSGVSDGQETKAINIKTKGGNLKGNFGRFYAGYGTDNRYNAGGNFNSFKGDRRILILGMSNNINLQNFGGEDLLGVLSAQSSGGRGGGRGGWRGNNNESFSTGQQGGISQTHAFGINYADKWGKKTDVTASYFFNLMNNSNLTELNRNFLTSVEGQLNQIYGENTNSNNSNFNHRASLRLEYKPDTLTTFIFAPRLSWQGNDNNNVFAGLNKLSNNEFLNSTNSETNSNGKAYNISGNTTYSRRFAKPRRSLTIDLTGSYNNQNSERQQLAANIYADNIDSTLLLDQFAKTYSNNSNASVDVSYNEPVGKNSTLTFGYNEGLVYGSSDKKTSDYNPATADYTILDTTLSNNINSIYQTHRPNFRYRYGSRESKATVMLGLSYQYATISNQQDFPVRPDIFKGFHSVLPIAMYRYQWSKTTSVRIFYRSYTNAPTANQLQNAIDNSNVLFLTAGNPNLKQSFSHFLTGRYNWINPKNAHSFFANAYGTFTNNYIGTSTLVAQNDTTLAAGVVLNKGAQLSQNVNLNGFLSLNGNLMYSLPVTAIKCNLTVSLGTTFTRLPSVVNLENNFTNNSNVNANFTVSSNINENIDFYLTYSPSYNVAQNKLRPELNTTFINHNTSARINWIFAKNFVVSTAVSHLAFTGLADGFNQNFLLLNGSFGYKFLKNRQAEVNITVFDALGQNQSISRTVGDIYIQDQSTQVLTRYVMLNFVYNLRAVKQGGKGDDKGGERPQGGSPHGAPHGGGGRPH